MVLSEMEVDDWAKEQEEDAVVREIDVFLNTHLDAGSNTIYILEYPLRPSWRPYEFSERCKEVRIKPSQSHLEVDLHNDTETGNFDASSSENSRFKNLTLSSLRLPSQIDYAVGVLKDNQVHLNPIDVILQLRPKINSEQPVHDEKMDVDMAKRTTENCEPWIKLEYHGQHTSYSRSCLQKMMAHVDEHIKFSMTESDYITSLVPSESFDKGSKMDVIRALLPLPLEQRIKKWLTEVCQICRFDAMMYLAPTNSEEEVLEVLKEYADLVRGLWICKSSLLFDDELLVNMRDFILLQITKRDSIPSHEITEFLKFSGNSPLAYAEAKNNFKLAMGPLLSFRPHVEDHKFVQPADSSFIKRYPKIASEQEQRWSVCERKLKEYFGQFRSKKPLELKDPSASLAINDALVEIFKANKVRNLRSITRDLRDIAKRQAARPKGGVKSRVLIDAASSPSHELEVLVKKVAVGVHDVYILKPSSAKAFGNVLIKLFSQKKANSKLQKAEILQMGKRILQREIKEAEFNQVMTEVCICAEDGYLLKNGD